MRRLEEATAELLEVLELAAILLAVLVVVGALVGLIRSVVQLSLGRSTLVLPFVGSAESSWVADVLAEQLDGIEKTVLERHQAIREVAGAPAAPLEVALGPIGRFLPEPPIDRKVESYVAEHPIDAKAFGPISVLGVTFSPDVLFTTLYRLRDLAARKTVRGSLYKIGGVYRLAARFTLPARDRRSQGEGADTVKRTIVVQRPAREDDSQLLDMADDLAFGIVRERLLLEAGTERWAAYSSFLTGYFSNLRFLRSGDVAWRDSALDCYTYAVRVDGRYHVAAYNAALLLYNKYRESENARAIDLFGSASQSEDEELQALALAGLTMAYAQNVHRFGLGRVPWVELANASAQRAVTLRPNLEETRFARAWAYQLSEDFDRAIAEYSAVASLAGDSLNERQIKSFAGNNHAYLLFTQKGDLTGAERLLLDIASLYPNKMVYANLADVARLQGDHERALGHLAEARSLDPLYAAAYNMTSVVHLEMARTHSHDRRQELIRTAQEWHARALGVVPETDAHQRAEMSATFDAALRALNKVSRTSVKEKAHATRASHQL